METAAARRMRVVDTLAVALLLCASAATVSRAQDTQQPDTSGIPGETPKPAARTVPLPIIGDQDETSETVNDLHPDTTPLTGIQSAGLGTQEFRHSYWQPGIQYGANIQSNAINQSPGSGSGWYVDNYVIGTVSLYEAWSRSQLAVNLSGGGFFSSNSAEGNGYYDQLALAQTFQLQRWQLAI